MRPIWPRRSRRAPCRAARRRSPASTGSTRSIELLTPSSWCCGKKRSLRPTPRYHYEGVFDPEQIPFVTPAVREREDVKSYVATSGAKAAAYYVQGEIHIVVHATSQNAAAPASVYPTIRRPIPPFFCSTQA